MGDIKFQERSYKPSKYHIMTDPEVATAPMGIHLDENKCIGCGVCILQCPSQVLKLVKRAAPSANQLPACQYNCPAGVEIQDYMKLMDNRAFFDEAWRVLTRTNPFPSVTGRVCPHPCESGCNRVYMDASLNINCIERSLGDHGIEKGLTFAPPAEKKDQKVAIIGSGPAGLSCAYQLALKGYQVTVFEASSKAGGMLSHAIPVFRLPDGVVEKEIKRITDLGVTLKLGVAVGTDILLDDLKRQFSAVYVAIGAQGSSALCIKGEESENVLSGLAFLRSIKENKPVELGNKVIVIGGGNTAVDAARSARRICRDVTILYRRTAAEMPAYAAEVEAAREEGVKIEFLCAPVNVSGKGESATVTCLRMQLVEADASGRLRPVPVEGSDFNLDCSTVIVAVGQEISSVGFEGLIGGTGWISTGDLGQTADKNVFAGGDAVSGPGLVSEAIGAGRKAALGIDAFIRGEQLELQEKKEISFKGIPMNGFHHFSECRKIGRCETGKLDPQKRLKNPDAEEALPFTPEQVENESRRCLECGQYRPEYATIRNTPYFGKVCIACHNCDAICPQGAITMDSFYRVDEGRWATAHGIPVEVQDGLPNPLRLPRPLPFTEIESRITEVEKVLYTRRSVRVFKPDPLPRELIERVLEAGRFSPTAGNCEGFKYTVITNRALMDEMNEATHNFLGNFAKIYMKKNPFMMMLKKLLCLIYPNATDPRPMAAVAGMISSQYGDGKMHAFFDAPCAIMITPHDLHISEPELGAGIACQNMVLAAHSLGLGTCYVGLAVNTINKDFKVKKKFRKKLGLEWPYEKPSMFVLLGYPAVQVDGAVPRTFPTVEWM